jgi:hypothetical protein
VLDAEAAALARWCAERGRNGPAGDTLAPQALPAPDGTRLAGSA